MFSGKDLRRLIIPLAIEQILAIGVGMVDSMMISNVGEAAISGVSLVDMINNLMINIFAAVSTGGAVVVSQYIGHRDREKACRTAGQLVTVALVFSLTIALVCLAAQRPILRFLFGKIENDVMDNCLTYFTISAFSYPFLALYNSAAAVFRSMGNSKISMFVSAGMNVVNGVGNAILIFGYGLGVAGAAYASLLSRALSAVIMLALLFGKKNYVYLKAANIFTFRRSLVGKIVFIALPNGFENGIF